MIHGLWKKEFGPDSVHCFVIWDGPVAMSTYPLRIALPTGQGGYQQAFSVP
jgi:hypothetical protein